ncbi:MAG: phage major capsid protein, partial [Acidimicrobiia bacterium]
MATPNRTIQQKADMEVADLIADGGYLQDEQANRFIMDMIEESVVLKMIDVRGLKSHTQLIDNVGITGFVLKPGTSGQALAEADRTKPGTTQRTLLTHLMKGEIDLNDEVLEDNIEGGNFKNTVRMMMAEHVALDMDNVCVNGDTAGATGTILDLIDGMIKSATAHVVAGGTVAINKTMLKNAVKAMPKRFNRTKRMQRFMTSDDAETDYRDYLADRATILGDKFLQDDVPVRYAGRPILPVPVFPDNLGVGTDETVVLLMDPKMARWGVWRKVKFETDRDVRTGEWIMVATVRAGFKYKDEDAVVK